MAKKEDLEEEVSSAAEGEEKAVDRGRYPGDIVRDKKSGKKGKFVNEYGNNGKAIIVLPDGQKRSELWDAGSVEVIKKVKRPAVAPVAPPPSLDDFADDDEDQDEDMEDENLEEDA